MTSPVPGVDVTGLTDPLPDPAHEAVRKTVLQALGVVWTDHVALVTRVVTLEQQMTALTARVKVLETPAPSPTPTPTPTPAPTPTPVVTP